MCGIAGMIDLEMKKSFDQGELKRMCDIIRHRGPDDDGYYLEPGIALGVRRLSIIDVEGGHQPIHNEDKTIWIVYNGEIFNYRELRRELERNGHAFYTRTDTEIIIHLYEEFKTGCLEKLRGQFAFVIWDKKEKRVFIARDRIGIRPLYYTVKKNILFFGSEIKSILTNSLINREIDAESLSQVYYAGYVCSPKTMFKSINSLGPAELLVVENKSITIEKYWEINYPPVNTNQKLEFYKNKFLELIEESTQYRLIADVPVGVFLSGGLDSSTVCSMVKKIHNLPLETFSLRFTDKYMNEVDYAKVVCRYLGIEPTILTCEQKNLAPAFPKFIWHSETPVLGIDNVSLMLLYKLAKKRAKVILTGEGSDELFAGYNLIIWDKIHGQFNKYPAKFMKPIFKWYHSKFQNSIDSMFPSANDLELYQQRYGFYPPDRYIYDSIRRGIESLYSDRLRESLKTYDPMDGFRLDISNIKDTSHVNKLHYYGCKILLPNYLLATHGDRVAAAHSVEARYPFLDHKLIEFSVTVPPSLRLHGLTGKYLVRKSMENKLPREIVWRKKHALRTPVTQIFFQKSSPEYVKELLSSSCIKRKGYFDPKAVAELIEKIRHRNISNIDETRGRARVETAIFVAILSTQLFDDIYISNFCEQPPAFC